MTTDAVGGVWRYSVDLAVALNAAGTRVLLVNVGPRPSAAQQEEVAALSRTRLVLLDEPLDWVAAEARELASLPARLDELAEGEEVDLLHLNLPTQAVGLRTRLPVVVVSHSCVVTWWQPVRREAFPADWHWLLEMNREGLRRADLVLAPTEAHADALVRAYGAPANLAIVPNAVAGREGGSLPKADRGPFVLAAARWWDEGKNAALLDRVAAMLPWPVRAAGSCEGSNGQTFTFSHAAALGALPHSDVRRLMDRAAIFISPSLYEPFGLAALEAAEAGAALVMADIPSYRELWNGAALFANPHDVDGFGRAVSGLIEDPERREAFARAARERAVRFTPERQMEALLAAYGSALPEPVARRQVGAR